MCVCVCVYACVSVCVCVCVCVCVVSVMRLVLPLKVEDGTLYTFSLLLASSQSAVTEHCSPAKMSLRQRCLNGQSNEKGSLRQRCLNGQSNEKGPCGNVSIYNQTKKDLAPTSQRTIKWKITCLRPRRLKRQANDNGPCADDVSTDNQSNKVLAPTTYQRTIKGKRSLRQRRFQLQSKCIGCALRETTRGFPWRRPCFITDSDPAFGGNVMHFVTLSVMSWGKYWTQVHSIQRLFLKHALRIECIHFMIRCIMKILFILLFL